MKRVPVDSEALRSVGFDARRRVLEIEFRSGEIYRYFDVPAGEHAALISAESHGAYFAAHIRDAGFPFEHIG